MTATAPTPRDLLVEARTLIARPETWTQGAGARDADGEPVGVEHEHAVSWCATGALNRAMYRHVEYPGGPAAACSGPASAPGTILTDTVRALTLGHYTEATTYNDATNHGCIVHAFDIAIADAGVREADVLDWWKRQPFDLGIPSYAGNCDLCYLKGRAKLIRLIREDPSRADWWIEQEAKVANRTGPDGRTCESMKRFRLGETYAELKSRRHGPPRPVRRSGARRGRERRLRLIRLSLHRLAARPSDSAGTSRSDRARRHPSESPGRPRERPRIFFMRARLHAAARPIHMPPQRGSPPEKPMTEPVIRSIPLDRLELSPANVRKTSAGQSAFAELKANIAANGVLANLVVRALGPDTQDNPRYAVIAGGRRLAALGELTQEGVFPPDYPVPCRIVANGAADQELSLAENVVRAAMHPADQVEAFGALALAGATVADIAARFGVSERIVEQRLRLGHVAPELLDAYREDKIDLAILKAFAVTTDRARQVAVWEQVSEQGYRPTDWQIKRMLTEDRVPAGAALARYVGVDAYEAAGGPVLRDLFADEHENGVWLEDPALLMKLALDRLQVAGDELATRWKWAEARLDVDWSDLARFGRVHPTPAEPTDEEKAEIERLHVRHDELVNLDEDEWTDELIEEAEAIEPRLAEIQDAIKARAVFKPEDIAISGCILTVGNDGQLQVVHGLVKPEDIPAKDAGDGDADTDRPESAHRRAARRLRDRRAVRLRPRHAARQARPGSRSAQGGRCRHRSRRRPPRHQDDAGQGASRR